MSISNSTCSLAVSLAIDVGTINGQFTNLCGIVLYFTKNTVPRISVNIQIAESCGPKLYSGIDFILHRKYQMPRSQIQVELNAIWGV